MIQFKRFDNILILILGFFFLFLLIAISYFGSPLDDEGFPFAVALRFIQGQKPFIDDLSPFISIGLFLYPLVKLSIIVHHGKNELILFLRHAYIAVQILFGIFAFLQARQYLSRFSAYFIAIMVAVYHSFHINNFHYDTLATTLLTVILLQAVSLLLKKANSFSSYIIFSILILFLCFVYPTFAFFLLPFSLIFYLNSHEKKKFLLPLITVFTVALLGMAWLIFSYFGVKFADLVNTMHFTHTLFQYSNERHNLIYKAIKLATNLLAMYGLEYLIFFILIGAIYKLKNIPYVGIILLLAALLTPLYSMSFQHASYRESFFFYNSIGFLGSLIYLVILRDNLIAKRLFYWVWLPAFFAGILTGVTSSNLDLNFNIGFFPAALISFIFVELAIRQIFKEAGTWSMYFSTRLVFIFAFAMTAFLQMNYFYGATEFGLAEYTQSVKYIRAGPFQGLYIDSDLAEKLKDMQQNIEKLDTDDSKSIYFGPYAGGYLLVNHLKPGDSFLYCFYKNRHFGEKIKIPGYIFIDPAYSNASDYLGGVTLKLISKQFFEVYLIS